MVTRHALCALLVATIGCGGKYGGGGSTTPKAGGGGATKASLAMAALPYHVLDGRSGRQVEEAAFWARLQRARAVCVGEDHPNPHHHWVQLRVVQELGKRKPA